MAISPRRARRRGMVMTAALSSRRHKQAAAQQTSATNQTPSADSGSAMSDQAITQLKQLPELRDQGVLTDAEFDAKKKQLLGL